jgi:hypothetical protein
MTCTIEVLPDAQAELEAEDIEDTYFEDVCSLALPTLQECWINEEDATYDTL